MPQLDVVPLISTMQSLWLVMVVLALDLIGVSKTLGELTGEIKASLFIIIQCLSEI